MVRHRLDSLRDVAKAGYYLRITCQGCGHQVEANATLLMAELGAERAKWRLERLEDKMRCRCGHRGAAINPCLANF